MWSTALPLFYITSLKIGNAYGVFLIMLHESEYLNIKVPKISIILDNDSCNIENTNLRMFWKIAVITESHQQIGF
jgi:hypothetical protein